MAQPLRVPSNRSDEPSVMRTATKSSLSATDRAMIPETRMLPKAAREVFLIAPRRVDMTTKAPSEKSRTGSSATTLSFSCSGSRLTKALPLAVRPAWGTSQTFLE